MFEDTVTKPCERLLVGISGSIQASQMFATVLSLRKQFADEVKVILTPTSAEMISASSLGVLTAEPPLLDIWGSAETVSPHIRLTRWAEVFLIMPASANTLGKIANGIADNLLTSAVLGADVPVVLVPGMNPSMYGKASVQRNIAQLREDGYLVLEPEEQTSVTTGNLHDVGLGLKLEQVLPHLFHTLMKSKREGFWEEAIREEPVTPADADGPKRQLPLVDSGSSRSDSA